MEPTKTSTETRSRLPLLLGLAVVLAGLLVWDRWGHRSSGGTSQEAAGAPPAAVKGLKPAATDSGGADADRSPHALASLTLDQLHDTVRRPLFERQRRPVVPPPARAAAAPGAPAGVPRAHADPSALSLQGILLNEGRSAIALMRRNRTGQHVRLQEGDTVDGWTIERIEARRVHLVQGNTRLALQLFQKR